MQEIVVVVLVVCGFNFDSFIWDVWCNEDSCWMVQFVWKVGCFDNLVYFCFIFGVYGGIVIVIDDMVYELINFIFNCLLWLLVLVVYFDFDEFEFVQLMFMVLFVQLVSN